MVRLLKDLIGQIFELLRVKLLNLPLTQTVPWPSKNFPNSHIFRTIGHPV